MRVLLDECLPRHLAHDLAPHDVRTVAQMGWAGITNGVLLAQIGASFDAFVTIDRGLRFQNQFKGLTFCVFLLQARSNTYAALRPLTPKLLDALKSARAGALVIIA